MLLLKRPYSGRIVTGVAIAFAERYRVPVWIVRIFLIASIFVSPIMLLVYLLFALSIPDERKVACELRVEAFGVDITPRHLFERVSNILSRRLITQRSGTTTLVAILLLILAAILEFPHVEGSSFYWAHPFITNAMSGLIWWAPILFYTSAAALFVFRWNGIGTGILWPNAVRDRFTPDRGPSKILGGIASGMSRVLQIDAAYIRVIWIALNILSVGLMGLLYLFLWFRRRSLLLLPEFEHPRDEDNDPGVNVSVVIRIAIALLLLLLGATHIATQTRLFFFNQEFISGLLFVAIGILLVWRGMLKDSAASNLNVLLFGASLFLVGIYFIASAVGHFQVNTIDRFEIAEIIAALILGYVAFVVLFSEARSIALYCALALAIAAAMIAFKIARPEYLAAIIRFYDFFYPIIFAALGLWITFDP